MEGTAGARAERTRVFDGRRPQESGEAQQGQEGAPRGRPEGVAQGQAAEADDGNGILVEDGGVRSSLQPVCRRRYDNAGIVFCFPSEAMLFVGVCFI